MNTATCPVEDCKLNVDIVLKSVDGELFGAHQRNLETYTEGFPLAGSTVVSDPASLEETAEVLRLMLRYTHHIRLPILDDISFTLLSSLAEAAEKYMIYSVMESCRSQMTLAVNDHPNEVFCYSVKHNYPVLCDLAAKLMLKNSASHFISVIREAGLHEDIAFRWIGYRDRWMKVLGDLPNFSPPYHSCKTCSFDRFQLAVIREVGQNPSALTEFSVIVGKSKEILCVGCRSDCRIWEKQVGKRIQNLPKYSEL